MLCVYGVVRSSHPAADSGGAGVTGVQGRPVFVVVSDDLAALVGEVEGELLARRRDVDAHLTVLERALSTGDVLPFRFGAVAADAVAVRAMLEKSAPRFRELLARVGGRVQMTLKLVRDDDAAVRAVVVSDARLRQVVTTHQRSTVFADKLALGERVAAAVEQLSRRDVDEVTRRLSAVASAMEISTATPPAIASIALLVDPDRLGELDRLVASLHDELGHRLSFDYAGPMPAYSFVS